MIYFVLAILILLIVYALTAGFNLKEITRMALPGIEGALIVAEVLFLIGCLTGLWRTGGTIAYFITAGVRLLPPSLFILSAFLLSSAMSLAIGTSFGVVATAGVILMSIARAGNINLILVAGAIMSGIYVGDRNSPAASSATLVAAVTDTDLNKNLSLMLKASAVPLAVCTLLYTVLSFISPMKDFDPKALSLLEESFVLSPLCILPALLMLVLPLCKVKVKTAMVLDIAVSFLIAIFVQRQPSLSVLKTMVLGYKAVDPSLSVLLDGGGIMSMLSVCITLILSGSFGDIMEGTGLLKKVHEKIGNASNKMGRFPTMILLSLLSCMLFCNQTIGVLMVDRLSDELYSADERYEKMIDIEDSVILLAGLVPWCIASSVPLTTLGVSTMALPFSFFIWIQPLYHLLTHSKKE